MRLAFSVLGPALFSALPLLGAATAAALCPAPAYAQEDPNLEEIEEQVLRQQIEQYLNEFARWDDQRHRVILGRDGDDERIKKAQKDLGPLAPIAEVLLQRMIAPGDDGRLRIKQTLKLRPFAKAVQDYIAEGGVEDIERFQRFRNGDGENPFKEGIPPRAQKAVTALLKALNDQGAQPRAGGDRDRDDERDEERRMAERQRAVEAKRREAEERLRAADEELRALKRGMEDLRREANPNPLRPEPRREQDRRTPDGSGGLMGDLRERIAKRFDLEPEEVDELMRYVREMSEQAREDMTRMREEMRVRVEEFRKSDRGQEMQDRFARLSRRAEDELRRFLESDETRERLSEMERRAMDFLASKEGQEMQRKLLEFLASEEGAKIRERLGEFMASERGRELLKQLGERFGGKKPKTTPAPDARRAEEARRADELRRRADEERRKVEEAPRREREERRDRRRPTEF